MVNRSALQSGTSQVTSWMRPVARGPRAGLSVLMWVLVAAYVAGLVAHGNGFDPMVDGWLSALIVVVPALVCWSALPAAGARWREPKVDLATNEVNGVEALVRWNHPTRGLLYPNRFLPLIEDAGLMKPLTQVVLEQALDQAVVWQASGRPLSVAVNLSASSLIDDGLPEQVAVMLAARHLPAGVLQLEITEEFLMTDRDRARDILVRLRMQGIQIAVDDFGTGYSSLAYLRDLPIDELKLDRSFILPMSTDSRAAALVFSTIALAHSLGLRMVAEGVEDEVALDELTRHGCDQAQGYVLSRPVPAGLLDLWLDQRASDLLPDKVG